MRTSCSDWVRDTWENRRRRAPLAFWPAGLGKGEALKGRSWAALLPGQVLGVPLLEHGVEEVSSPGVDLGWKGQKGALSRGRKAALGCSRGQSLCFLFCARTGGQTPQGRFTN